MKNFLLTLFLINALSFRLFCEDEIDVTQDIRILKLITPDICAFTLGIDPAIPKDFVGLKREGDPIWMYWGPEHVLKAFFKDEKSILQPFIRVSISMGMVQEGPEGFNRYKIREEFKRIDPDAMVYFGNWGSYPFFTSSAKMDAQKVNFAWVGLNTDGTCLQFHLVIPEGQEKEALILWNRFIKETRELPEPLFYKAQGQEMHPGYTVVELLGCKAKVIAERRKSDQKLQYAVIPLDPEIKFSFQEAFVGLKGGEWHANEPLLKLKGTFKVENEYNCTFFETTSVLIRETDEFTKIPTLQKNVFVGTKSGIE